MLNKKRFPVFLVLIVFILFLVIIFITPNKKDLVENNIGQEGSDLILELEDDFEPEIVLEAENNLESEELLAEEISAPIISNSSSTTPITIGEATTTKTSTIKKQMIVVEKEN